jgi:hypothetical protein
MPVSMSGLDLPWLKKDRPCQPGRYISDEARARRLDAARHARAMRSSVASPYFVPDVDAAYGGAWKSIVDGSEISSRSNWREHNKRNAVVDVGDKFWSPDGDDIKRTEEKMGFDPSLIGQDFHWGKDPALTD